MITHHRHGWQSVEYEPRQRKIDFRGSEVFVELMLEPRGKVISWLSRLHRTSTMTDDMTDRRIADSSEDAPDVTKQRRSL